MATKTPDMSETYLSGDKAAQWGRGTQRRDAAFGPATEMMLELAGLRAGDRVLDVAAGTGDSSLLAARRIGPSGHVLANRILVPPANHTGCGPLPVLQTFRGKEPFSSAWRIAKGTGDCFWGRASGLIDRVLWLRRPDCRLLHGHLSVFPSKKVLRRRCAEAITFNQRHTHLLACTFPLMTVHKLDRTLMSVVKLSR